MQFNNYFLLSTIDGILGRTFRVKPNPSAYPLRADQWLYICEPLHSLECELVRKASDLRPPEFPGQGIPVKSESDPKECPLSEARAFKLWDPAALTYRIVPELAPPELIDSSPLPRSVENQRSFSVDWRVIQILSGVRAVLLVLCDSCAECALDPDYVGDLPADDSLSAVVTMSFWPETAFVGNAKYWISWPLASFLRNPLPPCPSTWGLSPRATLFSGDTGRYYRRLAVYDDSRSDSASFYRANFSISQSKRGFATVPDVYVNMSFAKHAAQLKAASPPLTPEVRELAKRFAKTLLRNFRLKADMFQELTTLEPSTNACVESRRFEGGAREFLRRKIQSSQGSEPVLLGMREISPGQVVPEYGLPNFTPSQWEAELARHKPTDSFAFLSDRLIEKIEDALHQEGLRSSDLDLLEVPVCRVAPILEPLKVRMVTAMDGLLTFASTPLQLSLWKYLQSMPVFHLVGSPVTESYLHDLAMRHLSAGGKRTDSWVSGDYSAATDGLAIELSKILIDEVLDHLGDQPIARYREKLRSILTEQLITYPPSSGVDPILQRTGQLMGSKLSFPVLCMANLFAYILSLDSSRREESLRSFKVMQSLPVAINGDDILFLASLPAYDHWSQQIKLVGFTKSVGKNFFHPRFLTVNSAPIEFKWAETPYQFWSRFSWADMEESPIPWAISQVPQITFHGFLNVGLLTGQSKLTGRRKERNIPLSEWHRRAAVSAINPAKAHGWFLHYHRDEILQQTRFGGITLNLFAHPLKGGLGFSVPSGVEPRYSLEQRRLAEALWQSAMSSYEGQTSEFSLDSLLVLSDDLPSTSGTLGTRRQRSEIELYPVNLPLPSGFERFVDMTSVRGSVLSLGHPLVRRRVREVNSPAFSLTDLPDLSLDQLVSEFERRSLLNPRELEESIETWQVAQEYAIDDSHVRATCRLSNSKLRTLSKRHYYTTHDPLHPLEEMDSFPFIPIRRVEESHLFQKVYSTPVVQQDIVVDPGLELDAPFVPADLADWSSSDLRLPTVPEDDSWESQDFSSLTNPVEHPLPPVRNRRYFHAPRGQDGLTPVPMYRPV